MTDDLREFLCDLTLVDDHDWICTRCGYVRMFKRKYLCPAKVRALAAREERMREAVGIAEGGLWGIRDHGDEESSKVADETLDEMKDALGKAVEP